MRNKRQSSVYFTIAFTFVLVFFFTSESNDLGHDEVKTRMLGPLSYDDPDLFVYMKQHLLHQPSELPYDLVSDRVNQSIDAASYVRYRGEFAYVFYESTIRELFNGVHKGFFVEAGALDGEFLSNTLLLEAKLGWSGLLVEADRECFQELITKNRNTWMINACLAAKGYPYQDILVKFRPEKMLSDSFIKRAASAHGMMIGEDVGAAKDNSSPGHREYQPTTCIPLATMLLAIGVSHVDLISLDVEGMETSILRYFPWGNIVVDVWLVEHFILTDKKAPKPYKKIDHEFVNMFSDHGYVLFDVSDGNYVFVLQNSSVYNRAKGKMKRFNFTRVVE